MEHIKSMSGIHQESSDTAIDTILKGEKPKETSFAVFVFNSAGRIMLQQRSFYNSTDAGLWLNTCSGIVESCVDLQSTAQKRLVAEMGFNCSFSDELIYTFKEPKGTSVVHVFIGKSNQLPFINPLKVSAYKLMNLEEIEYDLEHSDEKYTQHFRLLMQAVKKDIFLQTNRME